MDLKSPWTLTVAWVLVPLVVTLASAGLGAGISVASGLRLGVLTLPSGYLAGVAIVTFALEVGIGGVAAAWICMACAVAGAVAFLARGRDLWPGWFDPANVLPALAALGAYAISMAPLTGSGRAGISGYVLDNDPSVHLSAVELLREHGASTSNVTASSFDHVATLFGSGYPLGSYAWPLFGTVFGVAPFYTWTPLIALSAAFTALIVFWLLRDFGASSLFSTVAAAVIACGYLPYSYLAQGGAKEVATATVVYGTVALLTLAWRERFGWRALIPAALGVAAAVDVIGLGAVAWLGPVALVVAALAYRWTPRGLSRSRAFVVLGVGAAIAIGLALPAGLSSLDYLRDSEDLLINPAQIGNLLGPVPWSEAFNVWLAHDYRFPTPEHHALTVIGILLAAGLAICGGLYAVHRRRLGLPLAIVSAVVATIVISARYSIYFDAKSYMVMAPALGMASAAGLVWLARLSGRTMAAAFVLGIALLLGVAWSDGMVYAGAWITPKKRFQELIDISKRFSGTGPILVNEREDYGKYFLRDSDPWESWGSWQPDRGLRFPTVPPVPETPDFDDYTPAHMARFKLLLERKRPGGSLPPGNFRPVYESEHYRVWERAAPPVKDHLALGLHTVAGTGRLDCRSADARRLFRAARDGRKPLRAAYGGDTPVLSGPARWQQYANWTGAPTEGFVTLRSGFAIAKPGLSPGTYGVWAQGSFGPGIRVSVNGQRVGEVFDDLGLQDGWQPIGAARVRGRDPDFVVLSLQKARLKTGRRRHDILGPLAFVAQSHAPRQVLVEPERARGLCGKELDWVELP